MEKRHNLPSTFFLFRIIRTRLRPDAGCAGPSGISSGISFIPSGEPLTITTSHLLSISSSKKTLAFYINKILSLCATGIDTGIFKGFRPVPLLIDFKTNDKIIINGAVLENAGPHAKILVHNQVAILRGKEIMTEDDAQTPASRVYFALQCAYIFPQKEDQYLSMFKKFADQYVGACPSAKPIVDEIENEISHSRAYKALKKCQALIEHETQVLAKLQDNLEKQQEPV